MSNVILYSDGVKVGEGNMPGHIQDSHDPLWLGAHKQGKGQQYRWLETFDGRMDEIRLWTRVLSGDDVRATYSKRLSGEEDGLAMYLAPALDGLSTTTFLRDLSGHNNDMLCHNAGMARGAAPLTDDLKAPDNAPK
mmetsp:Transcript_25255/g.54750  ORF Transcript_25255/g.54750 Transcript_25255/m.54750 type:complete len:136 (-) Transcript_25255:93-500(-)